MAAFVKSAGTERYEMAIKEYSTMGTDIDHTAMIKSLLHSSLQAQQSRPKTCFLGSYQTRCENQKI